MEYGRRLRLKETFFTLLRVFGGVLRFIFNISLLVVGVYFIYHFAGVGFNYAKEISSAAFEEEKSVREVNVEIPQGATTQDVGEILYEAGLTASVEWFRLQSRLEGMDGQFKAGKYTLSTKMSDAEIMEYLAKGESGLDDMLKITIPEGYTAMQIGQYLEENEFCTADEFRAAMRSGDYDYTFLSEVPKISDRGAYLEGYLFPDTYFVEEGVSPDEIVSKMLARFEQVYNEEAQNSGAEVPMDEIVIMASIIEGEMRVSEERELCASVINNRLDIGMPLQMDATVLYALGDRKKQLLIADLEVDSPYNTYKYPGLPLGPICNPGRAAIKAALNPARTDYLYYVVNDVETGSHEFTVDYESFLEAKERYRSIQ